MSPFFFIRKSFWARLSHNRKQERSISVPSVAAAERRFQALKTLAASGNPGCIEARRKLREATHASLRAQVRR